MANKNEKTTSTKKADELLLSVSDLLNKVWGLDYQISYINSNFDSFYRDMTWSRYGEILMLKDHLNSLIEGAQKLSEKIEKGDNEQNAG